MGLCIGILHFERLVARGSSTDNTSYATRLTRVLAENVQRQYNTDEADC